MSAAEWGKSICHQTVHLTRRLTSTGMMALVTERNESEPSSAVRGLVESGAGATGVAAGAILGYLAGGASPEGTVLGGVAGAALQDGMKATAGQVAERLFAETEKERVGGCLVLAHERIVQRLNEGQRLREPRFFERRTRRANKQLRSEAEELLEGTLLAARDAYEERKVELLARFYANVAFDNSLDTGTLLHLLSLAKSLTYRQLVILGIVGLHQLAGMAPNVSDSDFRDGGELSLATVGALFEIYEVVTLNLISSKSGAYILGAADINPAGLRIQGAGANLFNLLELHLVPQEDKEFFFEVFRQR